MGKNNQANRKAKKRKARRKISLPSTQSHDHMLAKLFGGWSLEVANGDEQRALYLFGIAVDFLSGKASIEDFLFLEAEIPRSWDFLERLLSLQQIVSRVLVSENMSLDVYDLMDIDDVLEQSEIEWRSIVNSRTVSYQDQLT